MTLLPTRLTDPPGGGLAKRPARALSRSLEDIRLTGCTDLARIDATSQRFEDVLAVSTRLVQQAMVDTVQVAQAEAVGAQLVPHAAGRLQYLANMHAVGEADVILQAQLALGRLAR